MAGTKKILSLILAVLLAVIVTVMPAAQVIVSAQTASGENTDSNEPGKYISEVRVGLGKSKDAAAASLTGYTILTDDKGGYADLNEGAESKSIIGSKGSKVVLLGYKTTNDPADAITDLAVMNMDGGYSVKNYELLMDKYLETQIKPMIEGFMAAITEYRANYVSSNPDNRKRAQFAHDMLNLLYDDDTESYLGDLLLNETKWEMGDEAYDALTDAEKKQHADLVTIFMQSNGQATLAIQNLLVRSSDTADDTWLERFINADADALMNELFPDMLPTDAEAMMDNIFGNDARKILALWDGLSEELGKYDEAAEYINKYDENNLNEAIEAMNENIGEDMTDRQKVEALAASVEAEAISSELSYNLSLTAVHDYLEETEYFDEFTLLDYFSQSREDVESDMMTLYALVSSLSPGQRAGLEYISLRELILMAMTDSDEYAAEDFKDNTPASIYEGVDRQIYEKGAVALTSDALRKGADYGIDSYPLSTLTTVMWGVSAATLAASIGTWTKLYLTNSKIASLETKIVSIENSVPKGFARNAIRQVPGVDDLKYISAEELQQTYGADIANKVAEGRQLAEQSRNLQSTTSLTKNLAIGFTVAVVIFTALSVYSTYRDLCDYYDADFSPIPNYMVDEADITRKKENGETYVIKNQTAYYKAALCNRTEKDEKYNEIDNKADLNGDVGRVWVALYSVKNAAQYPILADTFKVVYGTSNVPIGYSNGIHKFGSGAAFDMNNTYYAWNHGKGGIYVYYKVDDTVAPRANAYTSTVQTTGTLAAAGGGGLLVGFLAGSLLMNRRKKEEKE